MTKNASPPPRLKRLRRYGFKPTLHQRRMMKLERAHGAVPTDTDEGAVLMSRRFVAHDGTHHIARTWVFPGGSTYSYDEPANPETPSQK